MACALGRGSQVESEFQVSLCYVGETVSQENKTKENKPEGYNCNWVIKQSPNSSMPCVVQCPALHPQHCHRQKGREPPIPSAQTEKPLKVKYKCLTNLQSTVQPGTFIFWIKAFQVEGGSKSMKIFNCYYTPVCLTRNLHRARLTLSNGETVTFHRSQKAKAA